MMGVDDTSHLILFYAYQVNACTGSSMMTSLYTLDLLL